MKKRQTQAERDNVMGRELERVKREIEMAKRTDKEVVGRMDHDQPWTPAI